MRGDVAYDGTDFAGWAAQHGQRTVQGEIESALATALHLDEAPRVTCAGRTDAGVHARGQVFHADLGGDTDLEALMPRLRGLLPADIALHSLVLASEGFDARFSALERRYEYAVCDDPTSMDPLRRRSVVVHPRALDVDAMNAAARGLLGEHDFAAFCKRRDGGSTVRRLIELTWSRTDGLALMTVRADAFCHSMVRALVGALLPVGDGRRGVEWPAEVLAAGQRNPAVVVAPAHGLTLVEVRYPPDDQLAARQQVTRFFRGSDGAR